MALVTIVLCGILFSGLKAEENAVLKVNKTSLYKKQKKKKK